MERPILFSTPMIRAILDLLKWQTRRTRGLEQINKNPNKWRFIAPLTGSYKDQSSIIYRFVSKAYKAVNISCPYGIPGDVLWTKETFYAYGHWTLVTTTGLNSVKKEWHFYDLTLSEGLNYFYEECPPEKILKGRYGLGFFKRPSIFMPKVAARIWLEITDIRAERLQDITDNDAMCEGIELIESPSFFRNYLSKDGATFYSPIMSYQSLWESLNGKDSWNINPWVWVITFKRIER